MDRLACVDLPALALQVLLRGEPEWAGHPVAVLTEDRPQGLILQVNERARRHRVLPGLRYAAGLSLAPGLRAGVVEAERVAAATDELAALLRRFSPRVQPCVEEAGVFWLDATGLRRLWSSLRDWGEELATALKEAGWWASVALGFSRFSTYAIARAGGGRLTLLRDPAAESRLTMRVPLARLRFDDKARADLERLGVTTLGELVGLPSAGVLRRFGPLAARLWRLAAGHRRPMLRPVVPDEPLRRLEHLDHGTIHSSALLFRVKRLLAPLLALLADRHEVLATLSLELREEEGAEHVETLEPAAPTLDEALILDLVRLRLDALQLSAAVIDLALEVRGIAASAEQLRLYFDRPRRDLAAANRVLARLRAELGAEAVLVARPREAHLPEASFTLDRLTNLPERAVLPRPANSGERPPRRLVRRLLRRPRRLPPQSRHARDDGWLLHGLEQGSVIRSTGPFLVSGGWWHREVHREYQFAETQRGDLLWIYFDRVRRRWMWQGVVE